MFKGEDEKFSSISSETTSTRANENGNPRGKKREESKQGEDHPWLRTLVIWTAWLPTLTTWPRDQADHTAWGAASAHFPNSPMSLAIDTPAPSLLWLLASLPGQRRSVFFTPCLLESADNPDTNWSQLELKLLPAASKQLVCPHPICHDCNDDIKHMYAKFHILGLW